ncbi:type II toxin-antitoxin system ParD family antitoxin [Rubrimonas cliftonensis]|uniref:Antitoxin ParD1/3/4 n=1 Tax=Rubrimonas cliftonensis TaxID=89524 RepID=A0A1H4ERD2_9RHOB|nr:type II toxin-antitoxin system ParD family antitoxin [Rubrimonas cliftonensis]SEA87178.1 antitoxin ParD1/3/4 [Rubrimonas cliftonensis]
MTVKTTLSFTERHHSYLREKVRDGVFATTSAAVAAAVERLIEDEEARETALGAMADDIRARLGTSRDDYRDIDAVFADVERDIAAPDGA